LNKELCAYLLRTRWHFQHNMMVRNKKKLRKAVFDLYWSSGEYKKYKIPEFNLCWDYLESEGLIETGRKLK